MKMLKKKQQQAAIGLLPFFLLLSIAALGQGMPQVLRSDSKVALVNYTYLQNESEAMRNIQAVQKVQWQTLRQTVKTDKANIDTVSNVARKEQMLSAYANSYKKKTDDLRHAQEQQLKEIKLNIEAKVKAVAAEQGYTEIRNTTDNQPKGANDITQKVLYWSGIVGTSEVSSVALTGKQMQTIKQSIFSMMHPDGYC